jgi:hypothetical protein
MLVIIGPGWLQARDESGKRRMDDPEDWVHIEVSTGLSHNVCVIPVTVGGARLPAAQDLPEDLKALVQLQCRDLRDGDTWDSDLQLLIRRVNDELGVHGSAVRRSVFVSIGFAAVILSAVLYVLHSRGKESMTPLTVQSDPVAPHVAPAAAESKPLSMPPSAPSLPITIEGKWSTPVLTNPYAENEKFTLVFEFEMFGEKLSGSVTDDGEHYGIVDGKVRGDVISFYTQGEVNDGNETKPYKDFYDGKVKGDRIEFRRQDDLSNGGIPMNFVATRHAGLRQ